MRLATFLGLCVVFAACNQATAQSSLFGGGNTSGASGRTNTNLSTGGFGTSASFGTGGGNSLATGGGARGGAGGGLNQPQVTTQIGQLSSTAGQGFIGQQDNANRFIGSQNAGQQSLNAFSRGNMGGAGRDSGNFQGGQVETSTPPIQFSSRIGFDYQPRRLSRNSVTTSRISRSMSRVPGVTINVSGDRTIVLSGRVATENDVKLAEVLARLEPGVDQVVNELTLAGETEN